jgi:thiol-disulfide isomerase/thioredoxin
MRVRTYLITVLFVLFTFGSLATAQGRGNNKLKAGSPAPGINVEEWIKGEFNPAEAEVYVVDFWATWCGPCIRSIPHLTALQEEYELDGLKIVGISTDTDDDNGTALEKVQNEVRKQGINMNYIVGLDNRRRTKRAWMKAAGLDGLPSAFIVDRNGTIQWIGNPLDPDDKFDIYLAKVMSGRYDVNKMKEVRDSKDAAEYFRSGNSWDDARIAYENAIAIDPVVFADQYIELFTMLLIDKEDIAGAYAFANEIITERGSEDPELLTWLAKEIATNEAITGDARRMDVAMTAAKTALTFAKRKSDPTYISMIALVYFEDDKIDEAIDWQRKAYFAAREKKKGLFKRTLEEYRDKKQLADGG